MTMTRFNRKRFHINDRKFEELILYIAERSETDPNFGDTKLNKILFFSDMTAFVRRGQPITGHLYKKEKYGPVAKALLPVRKRMISENACATRSKAVATREQTRTISLRPPNLSIFDAEEIAIVDEIIALFWDQKAIEVSDLSHRLPAWIIKEIGEEIPYEAVFIDRRELTPREEQRAAEIAERSRA